MKQFLVENYVRSVPELKLSGKSFKYLLRVRRHRVGDILALTFPNGEKFPYRISDIDAGSSEVTLQRCEPGADGEKDRGEHELLQGLSELETCSSFRIILLQWLLKGGKMDSLVRQATEIGVRWIVPVCGEFSLVRNPGANKRERYQRIIKEARQQSNSPVASDITEAKNLDEALALLPQLITVAANETKQPSASKTNRQTPCDSVKICCTEKSGKTKTMHELAAQDFKVAVIAVGCEGGISDAEYKMLEAAGFAYCHFNTNILRAETAGIYALAALQTIKTEETVWQLKE